MTVPRDYTTSPEKESISDLVSRCDQVSLLCHLLIGRESGLEAQIHANLIEAQRSLAERRGTRGNISPLISHRGSEWLEVLCQSWTLNGQSTRT